MDKNLSLYSAYTTSASLSVEVFLNNKIFIVIAILSSLIGIWNAIAFLSKENSLNFSIYSIDKIFESTWIAGLSTPSMYSILVLIGDSYLEKILGIEIDTVTNHTIFLIACVTISLIFSRVVFHRILKKWENEK